MESNGPVGLIILGFVVGVMTVWLSPWFLPVTLLLFSVGIMWHMTEQRKFMAEDMTDLRKRLRRLTPDEEDEDEDSTSESAE